MRQIPSQLTPYTKHTQNFPVPDHLSQTDCRCTILIYQVEQYSCKKARKPQCFKGEPWQRGPVHALCRGDYNNLVIYWGFVVNHCMLSLRKERIENNKAQEGWIWVRNTTIFAASACSLWDWCDTCSGHSPLHWLFCQASQQPLCLPLSHRPVLQPQRLMDL